MLSESLIEAYGNKIRIRVNGILIRNEKLLLVKHIGLGEAGFLWSPPGGGMEFGTSAKENLKREYLEETGLEIEVEEFLFIAELVQSPLHAIEVFFKVRSTGGTLIQGVDPELNEDVQIIQKVEFLSIKEFNAIPPAGIHRSFRNIRNFEDIFKIKGYHTI